MSKFLRESESGFERIDTEAGVIYGVKVLGPKSRNGRVYEDAAIRRAVPMYEGVTVNLNHQRIEDGGRVVPDRPIQDRWGVLRNARYVEGSVYADLHYLKNHPATPQLIEAAERFPDTFGLSHDAAGDEQVVDGERRVIELFEIRSVDVVADPATNSGLFESLKRTPVMSKKYSEITERCGTKRLKECLCEAMGQYPELKEMDIEYGGDADGGIGAAFKAAMMKVLDDDSLDTVGKLGKLKAIMVAKEKAMEAIGEMGMSEADEMDEEPPMSGMEKPEDEMDEEPPMGMEEGGYKKMESRQLASKQKQLLEQIAGLQADLDRSKCRALLVESGVDVSDVRLKAMIALQESDRVDLVKTWKGSVGTKQRPARTGSVMTESASGCYPASTEEFSRLLG